MAGQRGIKSIETLTWTHRDSKLRKHVTWQIYISNSAMRAWWTTRNAEWGGKNSDHSVTWLNIEKCLAPLDWEFTPAHPGFSCIPGPEGIWLTSCLHPVFDFGTFSQWYFGKIKLCNVLTGNSRHTTRDVLSVRFTRSIILKQVSNSRAVRCSCWLLMKTVFSLFQHDWCKIRL